MSRCLIIPSISISSQRFATVGDRLMLPAIRFGALYWDRMHTTAFSQIQQPRIDEAISIGRDLDFIDIDIVDRPSFELDQIPEYIKEISLYMQKQINKEKQVCSIFEHDDSDIYPLIQLGQNQIVQRRILQVNLLNSVYVPGENVRIDAIREFREKRIDELEELHTAILDISRKFLELGDYKEALLLASKEIETNINRLDRLMAESHWDRIRKSVKTNIGGIVVDSLPVAAGGTESLLTGSFIPLAFGVGYGILQAIVKDARMSPSIPAEIAPFTYAIDAKKKFT